MGIACPPCFSLTSASAQPPALTCGYCHPQVDGTTPVPPLVEIKVKVPGRYERIARSLATFSRRMVKDFGVLAFTILFFCLNCVRICIVVFI